MKVLDTNVHSFHAHKTFNFLKNLYLGSFGNGFLGSGEQFPYRK